MGAYANALRLTGQAAAARDAYLEAIAVDSTDYEWIEGLMQVDANRALDALEAVRTGNDDEDWWQRGLAEGYLRTGRRTEGMAMYARLENNANALVSLARFDLPEGRRRMEALLAREPANASNWVMMGELEREHGNLEGARRAYAEAVRLEPTSLWNIARLRQVREVVPPPPAGR